MQYVHSQSIRRIQEHFRSQAEIKRRHRTFFVQHRPFVYCLLVPFTDRSVLFRHSQSESLFPVPDHPQ